MQLLIALSIGILIVIALVFLGRKFAGKFNPFGNARDPNATIDAFKSYEWSALKKKFNEEHADLGSDRLDRAYHVYYRVMCIAVDWNMYRPSNNSHVNRIAPFDKDVDTFWRFHALQPDYDTWCLTVFDGALRPRNETYEEPNWKTREERQQTRIAYKRAHKLCSHDPKYDHDDFIPPMIIV